MFITAPLWRCGIYVQATNCNVHLNLGRREVVGAEEKLNIIERFWGGKRIYNKCIWITKSEKEGKATRKSSKIIIPS